MAWTNSKIFSAFVTDSFNNTAALDLNSDALKAALYNNTPTPSQSAASASTAYNTGQWVTGNVVSDATGWPAVGRPLTTVASGFSANIFTFDADDTVSATNTTTLANVYGTLVYDDTLAAPVADQGICYNYFGGASSVTSGTFTIVWGANGILQITL